MRPLGILLVVAAVIAPIPWFLEIAGRGDPIAVASQYFGAAALIIMGLSQLLATRLRFLETIFGGLDQIYVLHKWLGVSAVSLILLHDTVDAEMDGLGAETLLVEFAETLGEISLYGFLALFVITISTFVPYHLWRMTHRFIGLFFAASAIHYAFILKPFSLYDPAGLYVLAFCALGITAYAYCFFVAGRLVGAHAYVVEDVSQTGDALAITLRPNGRGIHHAPGQFAFVQFQAPGLNETHPFTISDTADGDGRLRFTIKALGDFTEDLPDALKEGVPARIAGPYGRFIRKGRAAADIWIAAGIGVTPFVAWAEALAEDSAGAASDEQKPIWLFYCVKSRESAPHLPRLEALAETHRAFNLVLIQSINGKRLTIAQLAETYSGDITTANVAFCGPKPMRQDLQGGFKALGHPARRFHYEEFEIRSSLGLRRLLKWVLSLRKP